jgi:methionyl-tRNA formyltransferase
LSDSSSVTSSASRTRIAFAGTPEFAAVALRDLHAAGFEVVLVLTQPDRPAGRGMKLHASAVKQFALDHCMPVIQPRSLRLDGKFPDDAAAARDALRAAAPDVMVVAAYGLILPTWVLELPARGCLNIHGSLLPRWRGAAPIHRAIEAGDAETGITIMQMDAGLDTGAMLLSAAEPIRADDSTGTLHDRLAALGGRLVVQALLAPTLAPVAQPAEGVTYAHKVDKSEARIDWRQPAAVIERRVRAFDPFPGAAFEVQAGVDAGARVGNDVGARAEPVKLWRAALAPGAGEPGTVLPAPAGRCVVACGDGALELLELQRPGGRRGPTASFLAAHPLAAGTRLG